MGKRQIPLNIVKKYPAYFGKSLEMTKFVTMQQLKLNLSDSLYTAFGSSSPRVVMVQMLDQHQEESFGQETELIAQALGEVPFAMVGMKLHDWARDLTPWPDAKLSKRPEVGKGAGATFDRLTQQFCPALREAFGSVPAVLGGYSLGGLFSLWAARQTDFFEGIAGMSPSLWIQGWDEWSSEHAPKVRVVYLSLGDREEFGRNKYMGQVGDRVRREHSRLTEWLGSDRTTLVWNRGNHFQEIPARTAAGYVWCAQRLLEPVK